MTEQHNPRPWLPTASRRRRLLTLLSLGPTAVIIYFQFQTFGDKVSSLMGALCLTSGILFAWVFAGFWTAVAGYISLRWPRIERWAPENHKALPSETTRVAILMPIYSENISRVIAGVRASCVSLGATGYSRHFDVFILSDTRHPDAWLIERRMTQSLEEIDGWEGHAHFRHRVSNLNAKSGNVSDWFRRHGRSYDYAIVYDADSIMAGKTLVELLFMMEGNPTTGLIQTQPSPVLRNTAHGRMQQFAARVYGPLFAAGLRFWQQGDGHYIGHNAIIRCSAFLDACALPVLPGRKPFGGHILSHDFVEAALMARQGWDVWFAHNLDGSWEEIPPTLPDELSRDRRWALGNTQHLGLLFASGIRPAHRFLFINGILSFTSAPLWGVYLTLCLLMMLRALVDDTDMTLLALLVDRGAGLLPLFGLTVAALLTPKVLGLHLIWSQRRSHSFGGLDKAVWSAVIETILATLLSPTRMVYHSLFVFSSLMGRTLTWGAQERSDRKLSWPDAAARFWPCFILGALTSFLIYRTACGAENVQLIMGEGPESVALRYGAWFLPVILGLVLSIPLAVWGAAPKVGQAARRLGLFLIPEECRVPEELTIDDRPSPSRPLGGGFAFTIVDPVENALHARECLSKTNRVVIEPLTQTAMDKGPDALTEGQMNCLLRDRKAMTELHWQAWSAPPDNIWHSIVSRYLSEGAPPNPERRIGHR